MAAEDVIIAMMGECPASLEFAEEERKVLDYWVSTKIG